MNNKQSIGHLSALLTITIWGTTFISTKTLLLDFEPAEILIIRFVIGFLALFLACPHLLKISDRKQELIFAAAGLCGVCLYYLLENIALTFTQAANISVILSSAPFFTAILSHIFLSSEEKLSKSFFIGFFIAMTGICLISFSGAQLHLSPKGDLLAIAAAIVWAVYSILTKKISSYGYNTIQTTRRTFGYGILFMLPVMAFFGFRFEPSRFADFTNIFNILFLGLGASALCFVTWNTAIKLLGTIRSSIYIYIVPIITVVMSVLILHERVTWASLLGTVLILTGLLFSSDLPIRRKCKKAVGEKAARKI